MTIGKRTGFICLFIFSLVACSQPNSAIDKKNDVVAKGAEISNLDKFEKFVWNVEQGEVDKIRIVQYTHEGDPIFQTVEYRGGDIFHVLDNRQDRFSGDRKGLYEDSCKRIVKEQRELETAYRLIDCTNENGRNGYDLLYIPKK
ncbi:DUF4362 domain-containing protein [Bacillus mycoides]|uniref:DUF4362 domain-containing protein n=1 Tax=Bacillus mycoides TaxID=1405 RepID=UPI001A1D0F68|nr:DUF4362 domain-containing protein [Bacillus mycoides]MBJ7995109.1 DUF4362 domain-containing protein [Bacillus cereus]MED1404564.1 DUF4362 domain-containing protein [Bacillus mycoides]QWH82999.1 DUF4362 domain-containing protein [Bacillus mycoides]QWI98049.1 DUF4362 domain-containing protein [Bacillus mycoides]UNJ96623.1 DUF4362 domain-containing protein [Bacillus mycoides]